jgi:hypothetical protein
MGVLRDRRLHHVHHHRGERSGIQRLWFAPISLIKVFGCLAQMAAPSFDHLPVEVHPASSLPLPTATGGHRRRPSEHSSGVLAPLAPPVHRRVDQHRSGPMWGQWAMSTGTGTHARR